jgi:hypothetical protein
MSSISSAGVVGGIAAIALSTALFFFCLSSKEAHEPGKVGLGRKLPQAGGIPLIARPSLSAHSHSGELAVRLIQRIILSH